MINMDLVAMTKPSLGLHWIECTTIIRCRVQGSDFFFFFFFSVGVKSKEETGW